MKHIFHIGYHKTGTTWFQKYYYPAVKNAEYVDHILTRKIFLDKKEFDAPDLDKLKLEPGKTYIFCHEELSGNIHTGGMNSFVTKGMASRIRDSYPSARIVIFIRNQIDMIASCYSQYVKEGGTYNVKRYVFHKDFKKIFRSALFSFDHFNYYNIVDHYVKLFGRNNVKIFLYEDFAHDTENFIRKFEEGLELESSLFDQVKPNAGYRRSIMTLARMINVFYRGDVLYKYYLFNVPGLLRVSKRVLNFLNKHDVFGKRGDSEEILGASLVEYINNYYRESNNQLAITFNLDLKKYNYPT